MTDTPIGAMRLAEFRVGDVLSRTLSILGRNFLPFVLVAAIPQIPKLLLGQPMGTQFNGGSGQGAMTLLVGIITALLTLFSQATIIYATFDFLLGHEVNLGASFRVGGQRLGQTLLLWIYEGFAIAFAFILLLVPGLILLTMWYVAFPICVIERLDPILSISRSAQLTKGHRWRLFAVLFVFLLGSLVTGFVLGLFIGGAGAAISPSWIKWALMAARFVIQTLLGIYSAVLTTVIYHELRIAREGVDSEQVAAVFA
jgi:hypothetical protein